MAEYVVLATSLRPESRSSVLARALLAELEALAVSAEMIELREYPLPLCDASSAYGAPGVAELSARISAARVVFLATPVYNFDANAAAKNLIELTGSAWEGKIVGFLCAAGGRASFMSIMSLANSLMLDFRCIILPRFVYTTGDDFADGAISRAEIRQRIRQLAESALQLRLT